MNTEELKEGDEIRVKRGREYEQGVIRYIPSSRRKVWFHNEEGRYRMALMENVERIQKGTRI